MFIVVESKKLIDYTIFNVANGTEKVFAVLDSLSLDLLIEKYLFNEYFPLG